MFHKPLIVYAISFFVFLLLQQIAKEIRGLRLFDEKGTASHLPMLILLNGSGIVLFGLPFFVSGHPGTFVFFDLDTVSGPATWITIFFFLLSILLTPRILDKKFQDLQGYLPVRHMPGFFFYLVYFILRILFIGVYECWFRGFLLTDCVATVGVGWAICINLFLYALLHLVNGKDEVIAGLPYGLLLCGLCIWQGAVWPAVIIHLALTIPYEAGFVRKWKAKTSVQHEHISHRSLGLYR